MAPTTTKTRIIHILRFAGRYTVILQCGHKFELTLAEAKKDQLYIGKKIVCTTCKETK